MSLDRLVSIMERLRDPVSGCEWDSVQTFRSIAPYTIEEAYEVADAIERDDMDDLADELGDLQLQVVFHAQMAREVFGTNWIKLELIGDDDTFQPDVFALVEAAGVLTRDGFEVFPYTTEDLIVADKLVQAGCEVLMPWGAPIGSGRGLNNPYGLRSLRARFPTIPMIVDAGLGAPSHAATAMELGIDGILLNTAVAKAGDPVKMAHGFALAIEAGRAGYLADPIEPRDMAAPSTPVFGRAFT